MLPQGWLTCLCASALLAAAPAPATPKDDRETAVADALAVQTALQQGRDFLLRKDFKSAIQVLEAQLARINGNRIYLETLREAYRGYLQELRLAKQDKAAQLYLERLRILDPVAATTSSSPAAVRHEPVHNQPVKPIATVRAKSEEEIDPSRASSALRDVSGHARGLLARAEEAFARRGYAEAATWYEQAHQVDRTATRGSSERWAYCKLHQVVERLNQSGTTVDLAELERQVRSALELAPRLEFGNKLLEEIRLRQQTAGQRQLLSNSLRHLGRTQDGWEVVESPSFRLYHRQRREYAEQVLRVAENTRLEVEQKWFATNGEVWQPKCELYLHATAQDYNRVTGIAASSPGHSSIQMEQGSGRVTGRRIDLHCDDVNLLTCVLPHEATHVVLAGRFGSHPVPRWADEGMAVLSEPPEKVERHRRNLHHCRQQGQYFSLRQLMELADYPDPRAIPAFYAQSVSLVEFLVRERGPRVFSEFLRQGLQTGYESALEQHYGIRGYAELEQRWLRSLDSGTITRAGFAEPAR